jgi:hypothetical protein
MIAADQLRGELPERYLAKMCSGDFRSSLENDVVYKNVHHAHSNTETIVGHATKVTDCKPNPAKK